MKSIFEHNIGEIVYTTPYKFLYHITQAHGFAYTIDNNALKTSYQTGVSTTFNPKINDILGIQNPAFKFVLAAEKLVSKYGAYTYDFHTTKIGLGNSRSDASLKEDEIRINTQSIEPFNEYLIGVVLLFDLFSRSGIQWLLYDNKEYNGFMTRSLSAASRGIEALHKVMYVWKKPIFIGNVSHKPTNKELQFINDVYRIHKNGGDFRKGIYILAGKYNIKDFFGQEMSQKTIKRMEKTEQIVKKLNKYFSHKKYTNMNPKQTEKMFAEILNILHLNNNIKTVILQTMEEKNVFHPVIEAVKYTSIIRDLMYGDIDGALHAINDISEDNKRRIEDYDKDNYFYSHSYHNGTDMAEL